MTEYSQNISSFHIILGLESIFEYTRGCLCVNLQIFFKESTKFPLKLIMKYYFYPLNFNGKFQSRTDVAFPVFKG